MSSKIFATETLTVGGIAITLQRKPIKNINLKVHQPEGRVSISAPLNVDRETVRQFAESKLGWIQRKQAKVRSQRPPMVRQYISGEIHFFQGQPYKLQVHSTAGKQRVEHQKSDGEHRGSLHLYVRPAVGIAQREQVLYDWYRQQLKAIAPVLVKQFW